MSTSSSTHGSPIGTDGAPAGQPWGSHRRRRVARLAASVTATVVLPAVVSAAVAISMPVQNVEASPIGPLALRHATHLHNDLIPSTHSTCKMRVIRGGMPRLVNCQHHGALYYV